MGSSVRLLDPRRNVFVIIIFRIMISWRRRITKSNANSQDVLVLISHTFLYMDRKISNAIANTRIVFIISTKRFVKVALVNSSFRHGNALVGLNLINTKT